MSDTVKIKCNYVPRDTLYWHQLTDKERAEFDYLDTEDEQHSARFCRYKNWVYDLGEFTRIPRGLSDRPECKVLINFDGWKNDSFFSGILIKYVDEDDSVIVATYTC